MAIEALVEPGVRPMTDFAKLLTRIYLLDDAAREGLLVMLGPIVTLLENGDGCSITFVDPLGDGVLSVLALGNQALVHDIMHVAAQLSETMNNAHAGPLQ